VRSTSVFLPFSNNSFQQNIVALIKSISGIRGTIGGKPGTNLTPVDIVKFTAAFGSIMGGRGRIVIGRDGRISGQMVRDLVAGTLSAMGIDVIDLGLSTTPTVEIAVKSENAIGGIIITASHNPREWNALKLLNKEGEFISAEKGEEVLQLAEEMELPFSTVESLGNVIPDHSYLEKHVNAVAGHPMVHQKSIAKQNFRIVVDAINSTGALYVPALLRALGVEEVIVLNGEVNGKFAHNPEPLPDHLSELSSAVVQQNAHLGIAVDPDVDRLCFVCEDGSMFGEEYTLVAIADYVLGRMKKVNPATALNTVSNMSSTKALREITLRHGGEYFPSAVGEVNVVNKMKEVKAVIGGEGNGGIIVPDFHYGRDALIGIGIFLSHLANHKKGARSLRMLYPDYFISKNKIELENGVDVKGVFDRIRAKYSRYPINTEDGLKIEFDNDWVHLRTSNTEPIIRIYAESDFETKAQNIALQLMRDIKEFLS
jgi:phosphomannomutase